MRTPLHLSAVARCVVVAAASILSVAGRAADSAAEWRLLETPRFKVLSQLPDAETRAWAGEFDQFLSALSEMAPADESALPPLSVVLFARDAEFAAYKPANANGKRASHVGGFFVSRDTWSAIGLAERRADAETRETVFHEGVHWFTSMQPRSQPVWVEEGLADAFSTFRVEDGEAVWGAPPTSYLQFCREDAPLAPAELLDVRRGDALLEDERGAARFYVGSWAMVHFRLFGEGVGVDAGFDRYCQALQAGTPADAAFRAGFGQDAKSMKISLDGYLSGARFSTVRRPLHGNVRAEWPIAPASLFAREAALARLALGAGRIEVAREHVARALEAAPGQAGSAVLEAEFAAEIGDREAVLAACVKAIELGSQDPAVFHLLAETNFQILAEGGEIAAQDARGVSNIYLRALELRPYFRRAYRNLARLLCSTEQITPRDLAILEKGRSLYPADGEIPLGLAVLAMNRGDSTAAAQWVGEALRPTTEMSAEAREAAQALAAALAS
jgi:hypothetical protein